MGYHWIANPEPALQYDLVIFKNASARAIKVILARNHIEPDCYYATKYHDEAKGLRSLPFPPHVIREIWLKSRGEKIFRRLLVTDVGIGEIERWDPDKYINPHTRKELPVKRGPVGKFVVSKIPASRLYPPTTPCSPKPPEALVIPGHKGEAEK